MANEQPRIGSKMAPELGDFLPVPGFSENENRIPELLFEMSVSF